MDNKSSFFTNHIKPEIKLYMCSLRHNVNFNKQCLNKKYKTKCKTDLCRVSGANQQDSPPYSVTVGGDISAVDTD